MKMVSSIDEVLTPKEIGDIEAMQEEMEDIHKGRFLKNVLHIECVLDPDCKEVHLEIYESLKNPYLRLIPYKTVAETPKRANERDLFERRKRHKTEFVARRHEIVLDEIKIRGEDILAHKYFLSEREGYDVGLVVASVHWLKTESYRFYALSTLQHKQLDIGFELEGMEKAVVIAAPNKQKQENHYVIVMHQDIALEENIAQLTSGMYKSDTKIGMFFSL